VKLDTNHPYVKGIQNSSIKGTGLVQRGDNYKNWVGSFKYLLRKTHKARKEHFLT
jgi:hypothetical protein